MEFNQNEARYQLSDQSQRQGQWQRQIGAPFEGRMLGTVTLPPLNQDPAVNRDANRIQRLTGLQSPVADQFRHGEIATMPTRGGMMSELERKVKAAGLQGLSDLYEESDDSYTEARQHDEGSDDIKLIENSRNDERSIVKILDIQHLEISSIDPAQLKI